MNPHHLSQDTVTSSFMKKVTGDPKLRATGNKGACPLLALPAMVEGQTPAGPRSEQAEGEEAEGVESGWAAAGQPSDLLK